MAELDGSIFFRNKAPDVFGAVKDGMSMGQMIQDKRKQGQIDEAYKVGGGDAKQTMSALAERGFGKESMEMQDRSLAQEAAQLKVQNDKRTQFIDAFTRIAPNIKDQDSYTAGKQQLAKLGHDVSSSPDAYDPSYVQNVYGMALSAKEKMDNEFKERELIGKSADRREARDERRFQSGIKMDEKRERNIEQDMQKLSKDVSGTQEMIGGLDEVETVLGAPIDKFKSGEGGLSLNGKAVDLPGVSIPGLGRVSAYDKEARKLSDAASRVFNATLKDRSGGAVTDNEMERLKREFSEGKYNTEPELVDALQRYKRQTQVVLKNREAAYGPEVVSRYTDQGGRTSKTMGNETPRGKSVVKTQTNQKTGEQRIIYSDGTSETVSKVAGGR